MVIPAVSAMMFSKNNIVVLILAFTISILAGFFGLNISFHYDFPAGSSIVVVLGGIFFIASCFSIFKSRLKNKIV